MSSYLCCRSVHPSKQMEEPGPCVSEELGHVHLSMLLILLSDYVQVLTLTERTCTGMNFSPFAHQMRFHLNEISARCLHGVAIGLLLEEHCSTSAQAPAILVPFILGFLFLHCFLPCAPEGLDLFIVKENVKIDFRLLTSVQQSVSPATSGTFYVPDFL